MAGRNFSHPVIFIAKILPIWYNDTVKHGIVRGRCAAAFHSPRINRKDGATMTENLKAFLEKVSSDEALAEKAKALSGIQDQKEAIAATIQLAEEAGCILTEADLVPQSSEVSDDELGSVAGGFIPSLNTVFPVYDDGCGMNGI
jgi:predicted ribosomally synthesized peptide with nif11-like leader